MNKKFQECVDMMRQLVTDIQGAPYPGDDFEPELYRIWYEHAQRAAVDCFEYLEETFPKEKENFEKSLKQLFN
ncbi:MAG: hypothetical protein K6G80_09955 [Treponema sp.]|nr:hypothetical protein [Treponema sp.]